jgi:hypothetical protein
MKKLFILAVIGGLAACNSNTGESKTDSAKSADSAQKETIMYPYTASYSSQFEVGNSDYSLTLLKLYKAWDNNTIGNEAGSFADVDTLIFSDGTILAGSRDSVIAASKRVRSTMGDVHNDVIAWMPLKSIDRNENWVAIWTKEVRTAADGKKDSTYLHEVWRFNKDGKVDLMNQFEQKSPKPSKK